MDLQQLRNLPSGTIVRAGDVHRYDIERPFVVNWIVSNLCNYTCSYCSEVGVYNGEVVRMEQLTKCVDVVAGLGHNRIKFTLTGGEPTIHPDFMELVQYILETLGDRVFIHIMTNLSRSKRFYVEFSERFKAYASQIDFDASVHIEQVNMERFEQALAVLSEAGFVSVAYVLAHPRYMKIVRKTHGYLSSLTLDHFQARPPKVVVFGGGMPNPPIFTEEDREWLGIGQSGVDVPKNLFVDRLGDSCDNLTIVREVYDRNTLIAAQMNNFKGLWCNAGVDGIAVDQEGFVDRAVCFRGSGHDQLNIYRDQNIADSLGQPVRCPFEQCFCGADLIMPKYLVSELAPAF